MKSIKWYTQISLTVSLLSIIFAGSAYGVGEVTNNLVAAATDSLSYSDRLQGNTKSILLTLIKLERYNLNYRLNVAKQGRWKGWRYFVSQESNALVSDAGYIVGTAERYKNFDTPRKNKRNVLENSAILGMVGQIIGASGSGLEFSINAWHDREASQHGYSPKKARQTVLNICNNLKSEMLERQKIITEMRDHGINTDVAVAEENILSDMRTLSLEEFRSFHSDARGLLAFQQTLYVLDMARNTVGAISSHFAWDPLRYDNRHFNLAAGITANISGGLTMLNPIVSRMAGKMVEHYHQHYLQACFDGVEPANVDKLVRDVAHLKQVANDLAQSDMPILRCALYTNDEVGIRKEMDLASVELRNGVLSAAETVFAGELVGSTKLATGVLYDVAGVKYRRSAYHTNQMLAPANILGVVGNSYAAFENLRIQIKREHANYKLSKEGKLPDEVMKARLAKLDQVEKSLSGIPAM